MQDDRMWQKIMEAGQLEGRRIEFLEQSVSTNVDAARLGRQGVESGTVVVAESQSAGRGRLGRTWLSPPGKGLYLSMIWHSRMEVQDLAKITLTAGLALSLAIEESTGLTPQIKWPNDLLVNNQKVGGILSENCGRQDDHYLVIIGIGLNVTTEWHDFPHDLHEKATSLSLCSGKYFERSKLLFALLDQLDAWLVDLEHGNFSKVLASWRQRDATIGKKTTWLTPDGQVVTGTSLGVDNEGLLHIRGEAGKIYEVLSGDLRLNL